MARVPTADTSTFKGVQRPGRASFAGARAVGDLAQQQMFNVVAEEGRQLADVGFRLQDTHNNAKATQAFNSLREEASTFRAELLTREDAGPTELSKEYIEWYEKRMTHYNNEVLGNSAQTNIFNEMASSKRATDLDGIAKYEAGLAQKQLTSAEAGYAATTEGEIMEHGRNAAINAIEKDLREFRYLMDNMYRPGQDNTAVWKDYEEKLRAAAYAEMIIDHPVQALQQIEKHREALGASYRNLMNAAQEQTLYKEVERVYFPQTDYNSAIDYVNGVEEMGGTDVSRAVKNKVLSRIQSARYEMYYRENEVKRKNVEQVRNDFFDLIDDGSNQAAWNRADAARRSGKILAEEEYTLKRIAEQAKKEHTDQGLEKELILKVYTGEIRDIADVVKREEWVSRLNTGSLIKIRNEILKEFKTPQHLSMPINLAMQSWQKMFKDTDYDGQKDIFYGDLLQALQTARAEKKRNLTQQEALDVVKTLLDTHQKYANILGIEIPWGTTTLWEEMQKEKEGEESIAPQIREQTPSAIQEGSTGQMIPGHKTQNVAATAPVVPPVAGIPPSAQAKIIKHMIQQDMDYSTFNEYTIREIYDNHRDIYDPQNVPGGS